MYESLQTAFGLLGGLAIFIFGMNLMSENLQKVAGDRMRAILGALTKNPLLGVLAGALTTAVLQSSSATTVMAIGFVSAGLMGLPQAVSIILGANIGTTMTAQIIAFKITDYVLVFVFVGFVVNFLGRKQRTKDLGLTIMAFGLLFMGIETMGDTMKPLAGSEFFVDLISRVAEVPILGVAVGTVMTLVVQSSSATIAVLQNFASTPGPDGVSSIIGLAGAIPVLLGDNIGTTVTALLASVGQSKDAKRVAVSHCLFNISGALLFIWFVNPYAALITAVSPTGVEVEVIARQIANAHTGFNLIMTCIWLPLIGVLCRLATFIVRDDGSASPSGVEVAQRLSNPMYLDQGSIGKPVLALQLIAMELVRVGRILEDGLDRLTRALDKGERAEFEPAFQAVEASAELARQVKEYQTHLFTTGSLTEEQVTQTAEVMRILNDEERIGLACASTFKAAAAELPDKLLAQFSPSVGRVKDMLKHANAMLEGGNQDIAPLFNTKDGLIELDTELRKDFMKRARKDKSVASVSIVFNDTLHIIDRMANSCINIAESAAGKLDLSYFENAVTAAGNSAAPSRAEV